MAWTTPRTWAGAETVTATLLNTHVRDDLQYLYDTQVADEAIAVTNFYREASVKTITNTTDTALSKSVAGGTLGTDDSLVIEVVGDYLYSGGGSATLSGTVTYGGTTLFSFSESLASDANKRACYLRCVVAAVGATNVQIAHAHLMIGAVNTISGTATTPAVNKHAAYISAAEDSTGALTLAVNINTTSGSATFRRQFANIKRQS